jgi:glutamyl-tRNA reductase
MQLLALSLNYKSAALALRERVSRPEGERPAASAELRSLGPPIAESALLSTCNRTELYAAVDDPTAAAYGLTDWLARGDASLLSELRPHLRALSQEEAARHAFRVASGLESMVLGEPQILGQVKAAARRAQEAGTLGPLLHQMFQRAFAVAKQVRTRTDIGKGVLSHGAACVALACGLFSELVHSRVLFVGAGSMMESVAPHFAARQPRDIAVANRTPERGERIARRLCGRTLVLGEVGERLQDFDIVVACTGSAQPVVTREMVERAQLARGGRPLLLLDLGVPRDIEADAARLPGVSLYTIDDLGALVQARAGARGEALAQAEAIVDAQVASFMAWMALRPCVPLLQRLNEQVERLCAAELERARHILAVGHPAERALCSLASGLSNKLLHPPRTLLHGATHPDEAQRLLDHWVGALERGARPR